MILLQEKSTIVLAGAFNPAILTPNWVAKNALGYEKDRAFQVQVLAPVGGAIGVAHRFSFDGISYSPTLQNVMFYLDGKNIDECDRAAKVAARILDELPHTPILGVGFNFGFVVKDPSPALLDLLQGSAELAGAFPGGAQVVSRGWSNALTWLDSLVTIQCHFDGSIVNIDANFHHGVIAATDASLVLKKADSYKAHLNAALAAASALSQQDLEEA